MSPATGEAVTTLRTFVTPPTALEEATTRSAARAAIVEAAVLDHRANVFRKTSYLEGRQWSAPQIGL